MKAFKRLSVSRQRRTYRVRNKIRLQEGRPRLSVFRSNQHIYAQIIDDFDGKTLVSANTRETALKGQIKFGGNQDAATIVGKLLAERASAAGVKTVCFDRGHYKFHGRVKALAEAAREGGLEF